MSILSIENVYFNYGANEKDHSKFFLSDINLTFEKGEFVSLLGPNGSGKSTLFKIISGVLKTKKGRLVLDGKDYKLLSKKNLAKTIGFVPQASISVFPFSVYEIVMMGRTPYLNLVGYETDEDIAIVESALKLVEISHLKNQGINEVSGGEAQLAYIARAIVQEPEIILLDEPNAHLDIKHQISIFNLIKKLNKEKNLTVISVSHDLNLAGFYSDRIIFIKDGKIFKDASTNQILNKENIKSVFEVESFVSLHPDLNKLNITINPYLK
ncbi:MAG: ABC transporter ATP-binding protein [Ignavibacteriales bacterium]|nr:ABC transporter ATP-binding protein [Ignavibacteriales bacterium]